jgi:hypothetical protein
MVTHKIFLFWLIYIVIVLFGWGSAWVLNLPQIIIHHDHSYLTLVLIAMYGTAEVMSGRQAWKISKDNEIANEVIRWFSVHKAHDVTASLDGSVVLVSKTLIDDGPEIEYNVHMVPPSSVAEHFSMLLVKANAGQTKIHQDMILDITADRLYERTMIADFIASRIVWVGILATILGVIMAFWPMIDGASIDMMKTKLGAFFGGIAVAFIPTAVSFVFKIVLDFNTRIVSCGVRDLVDKIACMTETDFLPVVDRNDSLTK